MAQDPLAVPVGVVPELVVHRAGRRSRRRRLAITDRAGRWVTLQVGRHGRSVSEVAEDLGCGWHAVMDAVIAYGEEPIDHPDRFADVEALGLAGLALSRRRGGGNRDRLDHRPRCTGERGAVARHSVVMSDAVIRRGAHAMRTVLGEDVIVGRGSRLGANNAKHPVLIGAGRHLRADTHLEAGDHLDPSRAHQAAAAS